MKLLLDENISPVVLDAVKRLDSSIDIRHMHTLTPRANSIQICCASLMLLAMFW